MSEQDQDNRRHGSIQYQATDASYFARRGLRRYAGVGSLWALGVGAVISGDFFGWNFGLGAGGFGGLAIATLIVALMYLGICYSIAEMSPALPHTGGAYSFGRTAMGPLGRVHHRPSRKYGIHPNPRRHRSRHRRLYGRGVQRLIRR